MRARSLRACDPVRIALALFALCWLSQFPAIPAFAEDSVDQVLERMKPDSAVRISYRETRYLEFFDKPVEASGHFYGLPPDTLIKEQLKPTREVMAILKDRLVYFDPAHHVSHSQSKEPDDPMQLHIAAFQALANGNRDLLNDLYKVSFATEPGRWYMILSDKDNSNPLLRIIVSGISEAPADRIEIDEKDSDRSVYEIRKEAEGEPVRKTILELETELKGQ